MRLRTRFDLQVNGTEKKGTEFCTRAPLSFAHRLPSDGILRLRPRIESGRLCLPLSFPRKESFYLLYWAGILFI
jgi:hypothetical protein